MLLAGSHIDQLGLGRLGKDRRRITRRAVVDAADIERFEEQRLSSSFGNKLRDGGGWCETSFVRAPRC